MAASITLVRAWGLSANRFLNSKFYTSSDVNMILENTYARPKTCMIDDLRTLTAILKPTFLFFYSIEGPAQTVLNKQLKTFFDKVLIIKINYIKFFIQYKPLLN